MSEEEAFVRVLAGTRDHARTPMQWSSEDHAGFTTGKPWILMDDDYKKNNVRAQLKDEDSVLKFYQRAITLRREHPVIYYGEVVFTNKKEKNLFTYYRKNQEETLFVEVNLSADRLKRRKPVEGRVLLSTYRNSSHEFLEPYEAIIWVTGT